MKPFTPKEKALLGTSVLLLGALVGAVQWQQSLNEMPQVTIPSPRLPSPNAFDFYVKAFKTHVERPTTLYLGYNPQTKNIKTPKTLTFEQSLAHYRKPEVQKWLASNQTALKTLRQGMAYPYHQPAERLTPGVDLWTFFGTARGMTRTLVAESYIRAAHGKWSAAADSALDAIHLGHDMARGSTSLGARCGYAYQSMGRQPLIHLLPYLDAATCRKAARRLEKLHRSRVPLDTVLTEHKWAVQAILLDAMKQRDWHEAAAGCLGIDGEDYSATQWRNRSKRALMRDYTALMDSHILLAKQPYVKSPDAPRPTDPIFRSANLPFYQQRWFEARTAMCESLLITALALRAYHLENGTFPGKLDALVPGYLKSVPLDAMDEQPLRYKKQGATYVLWSIGPNGKDDGGLFGTSYSRDQEAVAKKNNVSKFYSVEANSTGDFVFGINH